MIKGALFDIDDTLFSHELKAVPKATYKALDKLRAKGIRIGICTSRSTAEMEDIPDELWDRIDCKIIGTGAVTMVEGKYFKSYTIDHEEVLKYLSFFNDHHISYHYTDINGDLYYWGNLDAVNKGRRLRFANGRVMFKEYEDEEITNLFFYDASDEELEKIKAINPQIQISLWGDCGNICALLVDKSFGLLKFCQMYSFTTDEIVAAGDGINDDVMLEMAGIGIATDDAKQNTKAAADYVCRKSIEDGGLYDALVETKVIEEDRHDPKMFVFDLDSTLFDHNLDCISEATLASLHALKDEGYILCLNSSRSYEELYNVPAEVLELMDELILLDGAYIRKDDQVQVSYLKQESIDRILAFFKENDITYRYCTDDGRGYLNRSDPSHEALFATLYGMIPQIKEYESERIVQILYYATGPLREKIMQLMADESCFKLYSGGEISPHGTSKGTGMLKVAEKHGIPAEAICAFGDSYNDIDMLQKAGLGIAVGNGSRECKDAADYIAEDIGREGFTKALIHFGFIGGD